MKVKIIKKNDTLTTENKEYFQSLPPTKPQNTKSAVVKNILGWVNELKRRKKLSCGKLKFFSMISDKISYVKLLGNFPFVIMGIRCFHRAII